ncbi:MULTISPECIES: hypothetical protein [Pseudomonas]|uniref:Uncharacterized protein n=2 Tax=Pseudomonas TaxID=286 RepID=A0ABX6HG03_9PSED|nr:MULTISPECIES: hypothetical protein [Pseudomonas]MBC3955210.1 hypothetical protein [Pseudomonas triticifolii]QHF04303.1 hypothetical protein N015_18570 [Pseudomonas asturiensis]
MTDALQPVQQGMSNTILLDLDTSSVINACNCGDLKCSYIEPESRQLHSTIHLCGPRCFLRSQPAHCFDCCAIADNMADISRLSSASILASNSMVLLTRRDMASALKALNRDQCVRSGARGCRAKHNQDKSVPNSTNDKALTIPAKLIIHPPSLAMEHV